LNDRSNTPAIRANGIVFSYEEGTRALDGVDFLCEAGEFVAILASNGSGKTTLIKLLAALLKPERGKVEIDGQDLKSYSPKDLYQKVGLVLQNARDQLFAATVEEDVAFGPRNLGLEESEVEQRVSESLRSVGAEGLRSRAIHHLSYGEQKRVSIAGVLAMRPSILILDEATAGLDPAGEMHMLKLLYWLNRAQGITVVLATHSVDMLPLFADRIYIMKNGRVLQSGSPREVFADPEMLDHAKLRLPHIAHLLHEMKHRDGVPIDGLPLTVGEARRKLLDLIPPEIFYRNGAEGES
jgi:cobalt/nickel transport system ATP-binding protein